MLYCEILGKGTKEAGEGIKENICVWRFRYENRSSAPVQHSRKYKQDML